MGSGVNWPGHLIYMEALGIQHIDFYVQDGKILFFELNLKSVECLYTYKRVKLRECLFSKYWDIIFLFQI